MPAPHWIGPKINNNIVNVRYAIEIKSGAYDAFLFFIFFRNFY